MDHRQMWKSENDRAEAVERTGMDIAKELRAAQQKIEPYFEDDHVRLYLGDCREVLPALGVTADLVVADPPYGETSLAWDRWPDGWLDVAAAVASSLWCFGSMRMFLARRDEFEGWKLSQDVIWEKNTGSSFVADRFKRVHEHALHWYRGDWGKAHHVTPRVQSYGKREAGEARRSATAHIRALSNVVSWTDDGTRIMRSVIEAPSMRGLAIHPTEKPVGILTPLIEYACPPGGLVVDPFAGSGSTLEAARLSGRRAIGIESHEPYAELAARRLAQQPLEAM